MSGENLWGEADDEAEEQTEVVEAEVVEGDTETESNNPIDSSTANTTELATADDSNSLVKPVEDIDAVVEVYEQFEEIKEKLLDKDSDITEIGRNYHVNKSGWRKIATAFNLTVETVDVSSVIENGIIKYTVKARAVAPNGKLSSATGMCASNESNYMRKLANEDTPKERAVEEAVNKNRVLLIDGWWRELKSPQAVNEHNVMATAETRARNRAISDLVGGGEVSAEEMASMKRDDILGEGE